MKKLLTGLISITIFFSFAVSARAYDDIPSDSPYFYAIEYLRRNDVFKNTKEFKPKTIITKAEFIKYLVLLNSPEFTRKKSAILPFEDTQNNAWYASYFDEAIRLGILSDRERKVNPYSKLSTIEAIELLFHSQSIPIPKVYKGIIPYKDVARNKRIAPMIMRALDFDLIESKEGEYLGIYKRVNRAEAARMIYKMDLVNLTSPSSNQVIESNSYDNELKKIINAWDLIFTNYLKRDELDKIEISDAAIDGMMEILDDPYSSYLDQEKNKAYSDNLSGEVEGIGAFVGVNENNEIIIIAPIKDSPAEKAGIEAGDVIIKVGDTDISGMDLLEGAGLIKGPRGTTVNLTIRRKGKIIKLDVMRDVITIDALDYEVSKNGKIMTATLRQFSQVADDQFQEVVEIIENNSDIKGLIIDLRDNPGGLLDSGTNILDFLLKKDSESVTIRYSNFEYTQYSKGPGQLSDFPMVVLINNGSASASEMVAGALQDLGIATIVGDTSFGKGTVQELNYFFDNSNLKLTVAEWLTPLRQKIDKNGITPDIEIGDNPNTDRDEQMDRAIQEVNRLILNK